MEITIQIVQELINNQFPEWKHLPIKPVEKSGHDNRTFHLGEDMTIRLPSGEDYVAQVEKELTWLPILGDGISMPISFPIAKGAPDKYFPYPWSINRYIKGETVNRNNIDQANLAVSLAAFLQELQKVEIGNGPVAGKHNFFRGGDLSVYQTQTEAALEQLKEELPVKKLRDIWDCGISSKWTKKPVWIHGDIAPGNLLVQDRALCGVIDFGIMGVGDPACDYAMAWTFFDKKNRALYLRDLDRELIERARGWALWKALITYHSDNAEVLNNAKYTIESILL